jgi:hypothetical protein
VADPAAHERAFDWQAGFHEVFAAGGFDVVIGNPPYVRQELLGPIKPHLQEHFRAFHGMADLYVYFYELGLRILRPGGRLSFIVTNKWMKAGYGEPLRRFFADEAWVESVVDFGHARQIFEDADVFPSIIVAKKPDKLPQPTTARLCVIPREQLRIDDLSRQIAEQAQELPLEQLRAESWQLEPAGITSLLRKVSETGETLLEYTKLSPVFGIKTGLNEAFLITSTARNELVKKDPQCASVIIPYVRGQDVKRWHPEWDGLWILLLKSSANVDWPWSTVEDDAKAEKTFARSMPSIYRHMKPYEARLRARSDKGRFWWELRSCAYYNVFEKEKLIWQDLSYHSRFALCPPGLVSEATVFSLATGDLWLLAVLNSPLMWAWLWRNTIHGKDEVLRLKSIYTEQVPIPAAPSRAMAKVERNATCLIENVRSQQGVARTILDWLRVEYEIEKPSLKLQSPVELDSDAFVGEVKRVRGKSKGLSAVALKNLRDEYARTIEPARTLASQSLVLERELSDLVNAAYGLTSEDVALMWATAPPRMPIPAP